MRTSSVIVFAVLLASSVSADTWQVTEPDPVVFALSPSLACTPGKLALTYVTPLTFSERDGSGWKETVLDRVCGTAPSVAYDPSGTPTLSEIEDGTLRYGRMTGGQWQFETVDVAAAAWTTSLVYDPAGEPAIAYHDVPTGVIKLARHEAGRWSIQTVTGASPDRVSLAFDGSGAPAIAYAPRMTGDVRVARWNGAGWTSELVATGTDPSLVLEPSGRLSLCYVGVGGVNYAVQGTTSWDTEKVDAAFSCSIAIDTTGTPAIAYPGSNGPQAVRLARRVAGTWEIQDIAPGSSSSHVAIATGDTTYVVFNDASRLVEARWNGASWDLIPIRDLEGNFKTGGVSLAFDAAGNEAVSYLTGAEVRLARRNGSSWSAEYVWYTFPHVARRTSLAFDGAGHPAIAFFDPMIQLILMSWDGSAWTSEEVPPGALTDPWARLRFDPSSQPVVFHGGVLSKRIGGTWTSELIDPQAREGSLVLDAGGLPRVSYYDIAARTLRYGSYDGTTWSFATVDASGDVGQYSSIALDPGGLPAISYYDTTARDLKLARFDGSSWSCEVVDSAGYVGRESSLRFDRTGAPAIAYLSDSSTGQARLARRIGGQWQIESWCFAGRDLDLGFDPDDEVPVIARHAGVRILVQRGSLSPRLHRGRVLDLAREWKPEALPLTSGNDDETAPFPLTVIEPGEASDTAAPSAPLVLYRLLLADGSEAGNTLRGHKQAAGAHWSF